MSSTEPKYNLSSVKHIIPVMSGKGGVGKSTVAVQLACSLRSLGKKVGILDIDLCGPSVPNMFGLIKCDVHQSEKGWLPIRTVDPDIAVMSIGFLLNNSSDAVIWRGPKKNAMIKQFVDDVFWEELDYLIIDTPPGTSDEHISIIENVKRFNLSGVVLVTTPQAVSVADVRREITFCKKMQVSIIGIVENLSGGFVCPNCKDCTPINIFSSDGGKILAEKYDIPFLGKIPIDTNLAKAMDTGEATSYAPSLSSAAFEEITRLVVEKVESDHS